MGNEVDFMVHGYVPLNIFGHEVWLTTTHVCLLIVCLFMLVIGLIVNNKMKHATEVPGMVQNIAELYVEFATPVSLSLRLFGNVMAGTIMLALYYGMLPVLATVVIPSFLHAYLDLFSGAIQAYVFCMLSMTFIYQKMPE